MYRKTGQLSLRKNKGKVANDYLTQTKKDLEDRLYRNYDKIEEAENSLVSAKAKRRSILADKVTGDNIYKALIFFDQMYEKLNEAEKREFLVQLISEVHVYEESKPNGQWLKSIEFKLPIIEHDMKLSLDNGDSVETVALLSLKTGQPKLEVTMEVDSDSNYTPEERATYQKNKMKISYL